MIKAFVNRPDRDPNIGIVERVAYGMGDFSSQLILTPVSMLFLYYATEFVNINISIVGGIMLASLMVSLIFSWAILLRKPRALMARPVSGSGAC